MFFGPEIITLLLAVLPSVLGKLFAHEKVVTSQVLNLTQNNNPPQEKIMQQEAAQNSAHELFTYAKYGAVITTGVLYAKTLYSIKKTQNLILTNQLLASWKTTTPFDVVIAMDNKQLVVDFQQEAKAKCAHELDFMYDPATFITVKIQEEYQLLRHYLELYNTLEMLHLTMLFPLDKNCRVAAKECLHKLALIKKLI